MIPQINDICCDSKSSQPILQLFDDKCFKIVEGENTTGGFCLGDFAFPADGYSCINIELSLSGGEHTIFDNELLPLAVPAENLPVDTSYARGILLYIKYPTTDINGEEISIQDKKVTLAIEGAESGSLVNYPLYNLFTMFTNPKSNDPLDLINRIKVINPSDLFKVQIKGLVIFGKTPEE